MKIPEISALLVYVVLQQQVGNEHDDDPRDLGLVHPAEACKHRQRLAHGHLLYERVKLRAVPQPLLHLGKKDKERNFI